MKPAKNIGESVIFLHIPKAAGSTMNTILDRQYKGNRIFSINGARIRESIDDFKNLSGAERAEIKLLKGHMHFGLHEYFSQPSVYITMLRNPVDRLVSHYYYVLRNPEHYLYDIVVSRHMTLDAYVDSGISPELDNGQVRFLSGHEREDDIGFCPEETLEKAKENLGNYFVVTGISERFDETLIMIKKALGWRGYPLYMKQNVKGKRPDISELTEMVAEKIRKTNDLDVRLYQWAAKAFAKRVEASSFMRRELAVFSLLNRFFRGYSVLKDS